MRISRAMLARRVGGVMTGTLALVAAAAPVAPALAVVPVPADDGQVPVSSRPLISGEDEIGDDAHGGATPAGSSDADGTSSSGTVTVKAADDVQSHVIHVYKLISGDVSGNGHISNESIQGNMSDRFWSDVTSRWHSEWGDSSNAQNVAEFLSKGLSGQNSADFAQWLTNEAVRLSDEGSAAIDFESDEPVTLEQGYWLLVGEDTMPMLVLVAPGQSIDIQEKASVPTVSKEIGEVRSDGTTDWGKYADASVGVDIPYRLTGTLPVNIAQFDAYYYSFVDSMEQGLSVPDLSSVHVFDVAPDGIRTEITRGAKIDFSNQRLTVTFDDLKSAAPDLTPEHQIVVEYMGRYVNGKESVGIADTNDNEVYLEYSKNPAYDSHGQTPRDRAHALTYQVSVDKVSSEDASKTLAGAEFTLQNVAGQYLTTDGEWVNVAGDNTTFTTADDGTVSFIGLDAGSYTLTEVKAPDGFILDSTPIVVSILNDLDVDSGVSTVSEQVVGSDAVSGTSNAQTGDNRVTVTNAPEKVTPPTPPTPNVPNTPETPTTPSQQTTTTTTTPSQQRMATTTSTSRTPVLSSMPQLGAGGLLVALGGGAALVAGGMMTRKRK